MSDLICYSHCSISVLVFTLCGAATLSFLTGETENEEYFLEVDLKTFTLVHFMLKILLPVSTLKSSYLNNLKDNQIVFVVNV